MKRYTIAIDQGTTSTRSIIFNENFEIVSGNQKEFKQYFPKDGCVEHDPEEIWETVLETSKNAIEQAKISASEIAGIGITNQRETTILWDKKNGQPVYKAIVWQDRRTVNYCNKLKDKNIGLVEKIQKITGLVLDSYFSATKINGLLIILLQQKILLKRMNCYLEQLILGFFGN